MSSTPAAMERKIRQLDNDVQSIYEMLAGIEATQRRHGNRLEEIDSSIGEVKVELTDLKNDVAGLKSDVGGLKSGVTGLTSDVAELKGGVADMNGKIDRILARLES